MAKPGTVNDLVSICLGIRKKLGESFGHMLISTVMVDTERNRHFRKFLEFNQFLIFLAFSLEEISELFADGKEFPDAELLKVK